jgi:hypothetical protein
MFKLGRIFLAAVLLVSFVLYYSLQKVNSNVQSGKYEWDTSPPANFNPELGPPGKYVKVTDVVYFTIAQKGLVRGTIFIGLFGTLDAALFLAHWGR